MGVSRRSVLRFSSTSLGLGLAGCTAISSPESGVTTTTQADSSTSTHTASPTDSNPRPPSLTFTAEVTQQASSESPTHVTASLTNTGTQPVRIGFGPALLFTDNSSDDLNWATDLVLVADTYTGPDEAPSEPANGCWRYPEEAFVGIQSSLDFRELAPEQSLVEGYSVYTRGDARSCLPQGTYRFQDEGYFEDESQPLILTLVLTIDENQQISALTEEPIVGSH